MAEPLTSARPHAPGVDVASSNGGGPPTPRAWGGCRFFEWFRRPPLAGQPTGAVDGDVVEHELAIRLGEPDPWLVGPELREGHGCVEAPKCIGCV